MIDFHSHFLPGIDDGAPDIETSLEMLSISKKLGIDTIVSTSHCYPYHGNDSILSFLDKRKSAFDAVSEEIKKNPELYPEILLGCEVHLVTDLSKYADLESLCIGDTNYILIEMSSSEWQDKHYEEVYKISKRGLRPIIAHLDRYLGWETKFPDLLSLNVLFQINAEAFLTSASRKSMLTLFMEDAIHVIGSDMHDLTTRPQNLPKAYEIIAKKYGEQYSSYLDLSCQSILKNADVPVPQFDKPSILKRIFL